MELFDKVFNRAIIYDGIYFSIKTVLIHPNFLALQLNDVKLSEMWKKIALTKYNWITDNDIENIYKKMAVYHPEFIKIVSITYGNVFHEEGKMKRYFNKIANNDETVVLITFFEILHRISSEATKSSPIFFPTLCGHNIINFDIPVLIKRFLHNRNKINDNKDLPLIIKNYLKSKPWDANIIDTVNVWKFNGHEHTSLNDIADFLNLKKTIELMSLEDLSEYYWQNIGQNSDTVIQTISLQSATQVNLIIQLLNELRTC